jgi:hypothetical protein
MLVGHPRDRPQTGARASGARDAIHSALGEVRDPPPLVEAHELDSALVFFLEWAMRISPPPPCLTMLVATSVTTRATRPAEVSSKPRSLAMPLATRRASPGWVSSATATATASIMSSTWQW